MILPFPTKAAPIMKQFEYWIARHPQDQRLSIIGKTRKEVLEKIAVIKSRAQTEAGRHSFEWPYPPSFDAPERLVIIHDDLFDFFDQVTGVDGGRACGLTERK